MSPQNSSPPLLTLQSGQVKREAACPNCNRHIRLEQVLRDKQCKFCKIRIVFSENFALMEVGG